MGRDRSRVLVFASAYLVLVVLSAFVLDWFELSAGGGRLAVGLRNATACEGGPCTTVGLGSIPGIGLYANGAWMTFWGTLLLTLLVGFQTVTRVLSGVANPRLSRIGVFGGLSMAATAAATAFLFAPEPGPMGDMLGVSFERTFAPWLMILAHVAGILAMYYAGLETTEDDVGAYRPVVLAKPAVDRAGPAATSSAGTPAASSPGPAIEPAGRGRGATTLPPIPTHLEKRLKLVVLTAELTRAGIDARREDGRSLLVMWRDVVGVVARRLPPELGDETFVDVVSTAGATLRVLAWTRLSGEPLLGAGDDRARALVTYVAASCPEARIDPATRSFVEHDEPAAQLASVEELAAHDSRLA